MITSVAMRDIPELAKWLQRCRYRSVSSIGDHEEPEVAPENWTGR